MRITLLLLTLILTPHLSSMMEKQSQDKTQEDTRTYVLRIKRFSHWALNLIDSMETEYNLYTDNNGTYPIIHGVKALKTVSNLLRKNFDKLDQELDDWIMILLLQEDQVNAMQRVNSSEIHKKRVIKARKIRRANSEPSLLSKKTLDSPRDSKPTLTALPNRKQLMYQEEDKEQNRKRTIKKKKRSNQLRLSSSSTSGKKGKTKRDVTPRPKRHLLK